MGTSARYVFRASVDAHRQITELFDFVHPASIAFWNLRWQVRGFVDSHKSATQVDIEARFSQGSGINGGAIRKMTTEMSWEDQLIRFSEVILVNSISIYEDFCAQMALMCAKPGVDPNKLSKAMQFPPSERSALSMCQPPSLALSGIFRWDAAVSRRYDPATLEGLKRCYRYFKEIRNDLAHNGRRATASTKESYDKFSATIAAGGLGGLSIPDHVPVTSVGDSVKPTYRGVIGFSEIILRLVTYYDVQMSARTCAECEVLGRIVTENEMWSANSDRIEKRIRRMFLSSGMPAINVTPQLRAFLKKEGLAP